MTVADDSRTMLHTGRSVSMQADRAHLFVARPSRCCRSSYTASSPRFSPDVGPGMEVESLHSQRSGRRQCNGNRCAQQQPREHHGIDQRTTKRRCLKGDQHDKPEGERDEALEYRKNPAVHLAGRAGRAHEPRRLAEGRARAAGRDFAADFALTHDWPVNVLSIPALRLAGPRLR